VLGVLIALHGLAHLVGFAAPLAGRLDLGDAGIRVVGVLWLLLAVALWVAAALMSRSWRVPTTDGGSSCLAGSQSRRMAGFAHRHTGERPRGVAK
jgi:hypothetical protein